MANLDQPYPATPFCRFLAERRVEDGPPLPQALLTVAQALADWQPTASLRYAGDPPRPIELTESAFAAYLAEIEHARTLGTPTIFRLASHADMPQLALFVDVESTPIGRVEYVWFSLPTTLAERALQLDSLIHLVATVSLGFGAYHGCVEDERLLLLYRATRAVERARAAVPPELRQFVPDPPTLEGAANTLPQLLVPQEFDRRHVPDAIWWINFWDRIQVETVGPDLIRTADWARLIEQPNGALVLVATDDPTDPANAAHLEQLRRIVEHLNLSQLQRRYRYKGNNS